MKGWAALLAAVLLAAATVPGAEARRRISAVGAPKGTSAAGTGAAPVIVDSAAAVMFGDTLGTAIPRMRYPAVSSLSVGLDVWDAAMRLFGQRQGLGSVAVSLGMHNRYFPTLEAGISRADETPAGSNFTFRSPTAPYLRLGADYNFFYNSDPSYKLMAGVRYGITRFRYTVADITLGDGYWGPDRPFDIPMQWATAGFLEIRLGLRVKIVGPLAMGWAAKFHTVVHRTRGPNGPPMAIPGYGKTAGSITGAFTVYYTLPLNTSKYPPVE